MTDAEGVQRELQEYLHNKGINTLFINIVESLLLTKPENPIQHIITYLQTNFPEQASVKKLSIVPPSVVKEGEPGTPHLRTFEYSCGLI